MIRRIFNTIEAAAGAFEEALERHVLAGWGLFSFFYIGWALFVSSRKQLWFDELVTYSVDHLPTWAGAWHALAIGVDANPPLFHFVNRLLLATFGDTNAVQRASSVFGFWAMLLCVFLIVHRKHSAAAAWVATLIPLCSGVAYYATEARPYGMVLGFVSFAILCWLNAVDVPPKRRWWILGLTLSLAAAISSHYYSVFIIGPFLAAELTRAAKRAKFDWPVTAAVLASCLPLVIFYKTGLMTAANQYTGSTGGASLLGPVYFWDFFLGPVMASVLLALAIALGWNWLAGNGSKISFQFGPSLIILIAFWFCIYQAGVVLAARYVTHAYENRYAVTAVLGAAILIGAGFDALRSAIPGSAGLAILMLLAPFSAEVVGSRDKPRGRHISYDWAHNIKGQPDLPIVYAGPLEFVQAWYNAPSEDLKRRITVLVDVQEARARTGSTTADLGVINLKPALPVPALGYHEFIALRKPFYLIHQPAIVSWVTGKLVDDGAQLKLQGLFGADELYLVTWPKETALEPPPKP